MDIRMPGLDGIEATRRLLRDGDAPRVLMLTTFDLDEYVYEALRAGASGFLLKDAPPEQLVGAVRTVAAGDALLAPAITRRLIEDFVRRPPPGARAARRELDELTDRELEVLRLIARGLVERRDRGRAVRQRGDGQDPRRPDPREARAARPRPGGRARVRDRLVQPAANPRPLEQRSDLNQKPAANGSMDVALHQDPPGGQGPSGIASPKGWVPVAHRPEPRACVR